MVDKIAEEAREIVDAGQDQAKREEEIGDLLFVVANLARHLKVDPEAALRAANAKFIRRFQFIEAALGGARARCRPAPAWRRWKRFGRRRSEKRTEPPPPQPSPFTIHMRR